MAKSRRSGQAADTLVPATLGWYRLRPTDKTVQYWNGSALTDVMPDFGKSYPTLVMQNGIVFQSSAPASAPKRVISAADKKEARDKSLKKFATILWIPVIFIFLMTVVVNAASNNSEPETVAAPIITEHPVEPEPPVVEAPPPIVVEPPVAPIKYDSCEEAIKMDGGNYQEGVDPEYRLYRDSDKDGFSCDAPQR